MTIKFVEYKRNIFSGQGQVSSVSNMNNNNCDEITEDVQVSDNSRGDKRRKEKKRRVTARSIRRAWNKLPSMQKSFLLMMLIQVALFIAIVVTTTTWQFSDDLNSDTDFDSLVNKEPENKIEIAENIPNAISLVLDKPAVIQFTKNKHPGNPRQQAVVEAFMHAWNGYRIYAWGKDNLKPISRTGSDWFGLGLTLVDSLDTMYIMGLQREYKEARDWVEESLTFNTTKDVNFFETTIRIMGGLLSSYHLSGDVMFLNKAETLGSILKVAFNSPSGVPYSDVNLVTKTAHGPGWSPDSTTAEASTVQLEFRDLSRATGNPEYELAAMSLSTHIHSKPKAHGLVPIFINPITGNFAASTTITVGARGDSYYEYLLKQWVQTGKTIDFLKEDYLLAIEGIKSDLLQRTAKSNLAFIGELENQGKTFKPKMDHLVCYLPGTLALGVLHGLPEWHLDLAKDLLYTCYLTYKQNPTGLAAEITHFKTENGSADDFYVKPNDAHNLLRPETVESLWYLHQITGDKKYQDWGWEMFLAFMKYTKTDSAFTSIKTVLDPNNVNPSDMMESFFMGETMKYFYLLFSDKEIFDLKSWVFNTEAHPLPIYDH